MTKTGEAKKVIKAAINGYLLKDEEGNYVGDPTYRMPLYLEGAPGIGKTEMCNQVALEMNIGFVSYSLVHCTKNNILGLPVIRDLPDGRKYTIYTMSELLAAVYKARDEGHKEGILMLDEFPCVSETIMPMMLAFLQTKVLGDYKLPEGWIIVLAGNPKEFNRYSRDFDSTILDRVRKIQIEHNSKDYLDYARKAGVHPTIIDYLEINPKECHVLTQERNIIKECVTYRSWSNLSEVIMTYESLGQEEDINAELVKQFIKSEVIALKFADYYKKLSAILSGSDFDKIYYEGKLAPSKMKELKALEYARKWKISEMLIKGVVNHTADIAGSTDESIMANGQIISDGINNVMKFLDKIDDTGVFNDRMLEAINNSEALMKVASLIHIEQYEKQLQKHYSIA